MTHCALCLTNAGRTHAERECCRIRRIAQAPRHQQQRIAEGMTMEERNEIRPKIVAEVERLKKMRGAR